MAAFFDRDQQLVRREIDYAFEHPHLQAAMVQLVDQFTQLVADAVARATRRNANALEIQVIAATLVWALTAAARTWHAEGYTRPLQLVLDEALAVVERGLRLNSDAPASESR